MCSSTSNPSSHAEKEDKEDIVNAIHPADCDATRDFLATCDGNISVYLPTSISTPSTTTTTTTGLTMMMVATTTASAIATAMAATATTPEAQDTDASRGPSLFFFLC